MTNSTELSETRADPIDSPTKSGRARLVEFGHKTVVPSVRENVCHNSKNVKGHFLDFEKNVKKR